MSESPIERAEQSVATRFSREMNATTSPFGVLTDPPVIAVVTAPFLVALVAMIQFEARPSLVTTFEVITAAPLACAIVVMIALSGARRRVITWLAGLPFPVENMNAVLNGLGESLSVTFREECPETTAINAKLEQVSQESFVSKSPSPGAATEALDLKTVEIHIGVADSKHNPSRSNHLRFAKVRALLEQVLVPLGEGHPIAEVRVK